MEGTRVKALKETMVELKIAPSRGAVALHGVDLRRDAAVVLLAMRRLTDEGKIQAPKSNAGADDFIRSLQSTTKLLQQFFESTPRQIKSSLAYLARRGYAQEVNVYAEDKWILTEAGVSASQRLLPFADLLRVQQSEPINDFVKTG